MTEGVTSHIHPRASTNPINRLKLVRVQRPQKSVENLSVIRTCGGRRGRSRRRAVPYTGIPMVDDRACDSRLRECERAMRTRSAQNPLGALKQPRHRLQRSTLSPLHEKVRTYFLICSPGTTRLPTSARPLQDRERQARILRYCAGTTYA